MKVKHKYKIATVIGLILCVVIVVFASKQYPVAFVGSGFITAAYKDQAIVIGKKLDPNVADEHILHQIIMVKQQQQLAKKLKIKPDIAAEWLFYRVEKDSEYIDLINNYFFGNEKLFLEYVVKPQAYEAVLRIKYNSDLMANNDSHNRAENILKSIKAGQPFEEAAKAQSDDKITGQLGGDLGFFSTGQVLPELEKGINVAKLGEVSDHIIASRLGYHIIFPIETAEQNGVKLWHAKHILVKTEGFDRWLNAQLNN